jgi:hypothetical protein
MQSVVCNQHDSNTGNAAPGILKNLFISLFMSVLSQSLFTLVRRNFMTLSFFTTRHTLLMFLFNDFISSVWLSLPQLHLSFQAL